MMTELESEIPTSPVAGTILRILGWICLVGGVLTAFIAVVTKESESVAIGLAAIASSVIFFWLGEVLKRLHHIEYHLWNANNRRSNTEGGPVRMPD